jgi:hypothetical protein
LTTDSVFTSLSELPTRQFTEAAYQLLILLRHRALLKQITEKEILEPVQSHGIVETNAALWRKIAQSLRMIEASEGESLADISDSALLKYRKALDQLLASKAPRTPKSTGASGQLVLNRLREDPDIRTQAGTIAVSAARRSSRKPEAARKGRRTALPAQSKSRKPAKPIAEIA